VLIAHLALRLSGLVLQIVLGNRYGEVISDVFNVVYDNIFMTAFLVGEQCLGPAYLPVFTSARENHGEAKAWEFTSTLFNVQFLILAVLIAALFAIPSRVTDVMSQWDSTKIKFSTISGERVEGNVIRRDADSITLKVSQGEKVFAQKEIDGFGKVNKELDGRASRREMANQMLPWMALGLLGMSLASLTYVVLNGYKEFFFAAFGDSVLKLSVLVGALAGWAYSIGLKENIDWRFIAAGAVIGGTAKLGTHLFALGRSRLKQYSFSFKLSDPLVQTFLMLALPLLAGIAVSRGRDTIINYVLTAREGLPSYYKRGRAISDSIGFLVPYTLSIALLPFFCDISNRDDRKQLGEILTRVVRMLLWCFVPVSVVLLFAANPICLTVYRGEGITAEHAGYSALVLKIACLQLPFIAVEMMTMQAYFSSRRMIAPTIAGFVFSALGAAVPYFLVITQGMSDTTQVLVITALSMVVTRVLKSLVLISMLKWTVPMLPFGETVAFGARLLFAGAISAAACYATQFLFEGPLKSVVKHIPSERLAYGIEAVLIGAAGAIAYLLISLLLKMEEPLMVLKWTKEKLKGRGGKAAATEASVSA
jgi:peptidoglycan biosynthesis protein MviN/MurJ (putative lipid II flippase)